MNCPLCEWNNFGQYRTGRDSYEGRCERCGFVRITHQAYTGLQPDNKRLLSAFFRRFPTDVEPPLVVTGNLGEVLSSLPRYTPMDKLDLVLDHLGRQTPELGVNVKFSPDLDYPLFVSSAREVQALLNEMVSQGWIVMEGIPDPDFRLTYKGFEELQRIRRYGPTSAKAFVAMWFDSSMAEVYDKAIEPAIREARYEPVRVDRGEFVGRIDDQIIAEIRRSRLMVADFTGQRAGVYFECGLMLGLSRTVIWMCRKSDLAELHFDTRQYNFIGYETVDEAKERLLYRILAVEGEGPINRRREQR